ncbi:MAG: c-type cytochrome [Zoogloeaceae bacterium]|jgi:cytochrome c5|nr:c-type cytochrome [Zoogloeaceae bacterium]
MATPLSFRSIMYAILAVTILPVMVACSPGDSDTTQDPGVEARIRPVARFELLAAEPAAAKDETATVTESAPESGEAPPTPEVETAAPAAATRDGATVYALVCRTCHDIGLAGAPRKGDTAAWAPRIATGREALYTSALQGKGVMARKGGNPSLSDDEVKGAVDYLVALAQ